MQYAYNYNSSISYHYSGLYYQYRCKGFGLERSSSYIYSIRLVISNVWNYVRARCTRINCGTDTDGIYKELTVNTPYMYSKIVDLAADYTGYKIKAKAIDTKGTEASIQTKETI